MSRFKVLITGSLVAEVRSTTNGIEIMAMSNTILTYQEICIENWI